MAIYSEFSHEKWWFSIAMLVYQRVYELSKCHCCILLIGYWLGGYFAWFIRDEFCCNLRRHTWDTYEPTNTMGWDRADRARTTGHDLAMKRNAMLRWLAMTCVLDIADFPCPIQIEIAFLQEGMKGVQLIMQLVQGHWRLKKNMVERLINDLCSSLFIFVQQLSWTTLMLIRQSTGTPWSLHPVPRYCASLTPGNGRWRLPHGLRGTSHLIRGSSSASRRWMVSWICLMTSENGIWTIQYLPSGKLT